MDFDSVCDAAVASSISRLDVETASRLIASCVYHEMKERGKRLRREFEKEIVSGEIRESLEACRLDEVRKMFHKALSKFSDVPTDALHRFIDELVVKEVLET